MKQKKDKSKSAKTDVPKKKSLRDLAVLAGFFALPVLLVIWMARPAAPVRSGNLSSTTGPASPSPNQIQSSEKGSVPPPDNKSAATPAAAGTLTPVTPSAPM